MKEDEFQKERRKVEKQDPSEKKKKGHIIRLRKKLKSKRFCKFFSNTDEGIAELGRLCINSIHQLINERQLDENIGWLKATSQEVSTLRQISKNKFLDREIRRMREFSIVGERVTIDKESKAIEAQEFWETMMGPIRRNGYKKLFFESGSTLSYVSEVFENYGLKSDKEPGAWCIWTNNVLALFQLVLFTDVNVSRFPPFAPDPEDKYGAIFPRNWHTMLERPPSKPRELHQTEVDAVNEMKQRLHQFGEKILLLTTTSGWDIEHESANFQGPHVGSHPNMLFKRALFTTGHPVVIFLTAEKLGDPFIVGECFPIFGPDEPLDAALNKYPIALCVGYDKTLHSDTRWPLKPRDRELRNDPSNILNILHDLGFNVIYTKNDKRAGAIVAGNTSFHALLPND